MLWWCAGQQMTRSEPGFPQAVYCTNYKQLLLSQHHSLTRCFLYEVDYMYKIFYQFLSDLWCWQMFCFYDIVCVLVASIIFWFLTKAACATFSCSGDTYFISCISILLCFSGCVALWLFLCLSSLSLAKLPRKFSNPGTKHTYIFLRKQ